MVGGGKYNNCVVDVEEALVYEAALVTPSKEATGVYAAVVASAGRSMKASAAAATSYQVSACTQTSMPLIVCTLLLVSMAPFATKSLYG